MNAYISVGKSCPETKMSQIKENSDIMSILAQRLFNTNFRIYAGLLSQSHSGWLSDGWMTVLAKPAKPQNESWPT